jgi:hypothetical protein
MLDPRKGSRSVLLLFQFIEWALDQAGTTGTETCPPFFLHLGFVLQELLETVSDDYLICKYCTNFNSLNCTYSRIKTCINNWQGLCCRVWARHFSLPRP